jgi:hypothetical protein
LRVLGHLGSASLPRRSGEAQHDE